MEQSAFSFGNFTWWVGKAVGRMDNLKDGRIKVRIFGYHTEDIPEDALPWGIVMTPITSASLGGIGVSPTGILENTTLVGFFADGINNQVPIILGTLPGIPSKDGKTPNEPDTNRLARNEKISETIVQEKRDNIIEAQKAFGGEWKEPKTEYNAKYPYNHVRETESGHIEEFDDTPGSERYSLWHKKGTFEEIYPNGQKVQKIVKDNYTILLGENYLYVKEDAFSRMIS